MADRPLIAVTGRRLGRREAWPYSGASALARGYLDGVERAGGQPLVVDLTATHPEQAATLLARLDGLVLTGGPDVDPACYAEPAHEKTYGVDRHADDVEIALLRAALAASVPTLAICRGIQITNVACGGTLHQHITEDPGVEPHGAPGTGGRLEHTVSIDDGSLLAKTMDTTAPLVSCHHHQSIARVGDGLRVVARASDGIVEGMELEGGGPWFLAVQWHPEDTAAADPHQQALFNSLAEASRGARA